MRRASAIPRTHVRISPHLVGEPIDLAAGLVLAAAEVKFLEALGDGRGDPPLVARCACVVPDRHLLAGQP